MSLVLDALRKQQMDTDSGTALSLALQDARPRRQRLGITLLAFALLCNAALMSWLFRDRLFGVELPGPAAGQAQVPTAAPLLSDTPTEAPDTHSTAGPTPALPPGAPARATPPATDAGTTLPPSAPAFTPGSAYAPMSGTTQPAYGSPGYAAPAGQQWPGTTAISSPTLERVALDALPPAARARFPGIAISTHVFAQDPALRAIIANGARLQEGDQIAGLRLREIDEDGVLIEFENYLVDVPVFNDW